MFWTLLLQGLIIVAVVVSLPLLTLSEAGDAFQATTSNAGASQRRCLLTLAPSDVVFVVVVVPGSGAGLSAGTKPWRRMPCWASSASSHRHCRCSSRDNDSNGGGGRITEEADVVVAVAF